MKDEQKTKEQLIEELKVVRLQLATLEKKANRNSKRLEEEMQQQTYKLAERIKELDCLYNMSDLIETPGISLEGILRGTVELLPRAWQYPSLACARIILQDQTYKTANFQESEWRLISDINVQGELTGMVEVYYLQEPPPNGYEPFLPEEITLLNALAKRLGRIIERKRAEEALRESEEQYRSIFTKSHATILLIDPETADIVDASPAACKYYGYNIEELRTKKITDINTLTPQQVFEEMERAKAEQRKHFYFQHRLANGDVQPVDVYSGPIEIKGKTLLFSIVHDISERRKAEEAREMLILDLREALSKTKILSGMLPICTSCKKIRDDKGYWNQIESYIRRHSEAEFSHSICPECAKKLYPEYYK